jgi:AcrR family transcriptional regulator
VAPKAGLDRIAVVAAAARQLDATGGREISMADLASQLGVRTPSLYNHIGGQDELRSELVLLGLRELGTRLGRAAIGKAGAPAIFALADAYRAFARERPGLYPLTQRAGDLTSAAHIAASAAVIETLSAVLAGFGLYDTAAVHTIRGFRSLLHGFVSLETAGGFGIPLSVDESFERLVQLFVAGLPAYVVDAAAEARRP